MTPQNLRVSYDLQNYDLSMQNDVTHLINHQLLPDRPHLASEILDVDLAINRSSYVQFSMKHF